MAVVSGLQSAPIFRLTKTWALLSRKDKASFDKLEYIMSKEDNYKRLRDYIGSLKMTPCIPYLAYPSTGSILENEQRSNLMNNILRIISDLQQSCEYDIPVLPHVQKYLNSVQYIEELQKFVEDDNYKLSLKIEPGTSTPRATASREDLVGPEVGVSPQMVRKNATAEGALLPPTPPSPRNLMPHGHRKCHSLGYNFIHKMNTAEFKSATFPNAGPRHLLDDSVMEPHGPLRGQAESSTLSSGISIGSSDGSELSEETSWPAFESSAESEDLAVHLYPGAVTIQGVLRRKTLLKEGKKPTVASWTKYWVALCGTQLFYYAAKSLKATERKHFKSTPSKNVSVVGWMVMMADDPDHPDLFLLTDSEKGNSYKFQAGNRMNAMLWFKHLSAACQSNRQQVPANLMTFE
ncbi:Ras-specific guanine nucleotide-releasing factor RalGPS2 [Ophiophagus hannah]|uniref:Ras-specific guanine nucleotide-releasing factor RalGPS2 n=1 Tax=Ophiophagus hannah TaxID=8665 RepID=V8NVB1_OPHHA|nr:Ras-specific guanine nucleotide-releasing factor RalGPS2 [Ophiophagus hannah]